MDRKMENFIEFWARYTHKGVSRKMRVRFYFYGRDKADYYEIRCKKDRSGLRKISGRWRAISGLPMNDDLLQIVGAAIMQEMNSIILHINDSPPTPRRA